jgi:hypothetical protein
LSHSRILLNVQFRSVTTDSPSSADMPVQIVNSIESIQDSNQLIAKANPDHDPAPLTAGLATLVHTLLDCLHQNRPLKEVEPALNGVKRPARRSPSSRQRPGGESSARRTYP